MDRFENLELDATPHTAAIPQKTPETSRWTEPEVEGAEVPEPEPTGEGMSLSDYVLGTGPASRALIASGHHLPIDLVPMQLAEAPKVEPTGPWGKGLEKFASVVDTATGRILGRPVSSRYKVCQNATLARLIDVIAPADADVKCRVMADGASLAFEVPIDSAPISDGQLEYMKTQRKKWNQDAHGWSQEQAPEVVPPMENKILFFNQHGSMGKLRARHLVKFLACDNGMVMNASQCGFAWSHHAYLDERIEQAREAFELAREDASATRELFCGLFGQKIGALEFDAFLDHLYPETKKIRENAKGRARLEWTKRREVMSHAYNHAPGATPGTAHGLMMASSFVNTHSRRANGSNKEEKRYLLTIDGAGAAENHAAMQYCYQLAS